MATFYKDCGEISIYIFDKILSSNDYSHLIIEGEVAPEILEEAWGGIYEEYCKLSEDNASLMYFALCSELLFLETRYAMASQLLGQIIKCAEIPEVVEIYIDTLAKWDYKINKNKDLGEELNRMFTKLKQSQNKIKLKKGELEGYKSDDEPMTLTQQVVKLEQALGRNEIDPRKTSVEKWIMLVKEVKEKNDQRKKVRK